MSRFADSIDLLLGDSPWDAQRRREHEATDSNFDPEGIEDARRRIMRSLVVRQGQGKFRTVLLETLEHRCAVTGSDFEGTLEAAHIRPYAGLQTNHVSNGLLLRANITRSTTFGYWPYMRITCCVVVAHTRRHLVRAARECCRANGYRSKLSERPCAPLPADVMRFVGTANHALARGMGGDGSRPSAARAS